MKKIVIFIISLLLIFNVGCEHSDDSISSIISTYETVTTSEVYEPPIVSKDNLEDWGTFADVTSLYTKLYRNIENPTYVLVNVKNVWIIRDNAVNGIIFIWNYDSLKKSERTNDNGEVVPLRDNEQMRIYMKDDTTDRVLKGDLVNITGIFDTENKVIFDAEYEMIMSTDEW